MTSTKRLFACFIGVFAALLIAAAALVSPAYADSGNSDKAAGSNGLYTSLGDSITAGFAFDDPIRSKCKGFVVSETAYPYIVSKAMHLTENPRACVAYRTNEVLRLLGEEADYGYFYDFWEAYGAWKTVDTPSSDEVLEELSESDLITLDIGTNDILTAPVINAYMQVLEDEGMYDEYADLIAEYLIDDDFIDLFTEIYETMKELDLDMEFVFEFIDQIYECADSFETNYDEIMQIITSQNDSATVALVGLYNPYRYATYTIDGESAEIGQVIGLMIDLENDFIEEEAEEYGCVFVDVSDTASPVSDLGADFDFSEIESISDLTGCDMHPTDAGHEYMAVQILKALDSCNTVDHYWGAWTLDGSQRERTCKVCGETESSAMLFPDVTDPSSWYFSWVYQAYDLGLFNGYDNGFFGPEDTLSRGMVVTLLYRAYTGETAETTDNDVDTRYSDVSAGDWYAAAVRWADWTGITTGYEGTGTFAPNSPVTREELATFMARYAAYVESDGESVDAAEVFDIDYTGIEGMDDADDVSDFAYDGMAWCIDNDIISGFDGTASIEPAAQATRAQMAKIITLTVHDVLGQR